MKRILLLIFLVILLSACSPTVKPTDAPAQPAPAAVEPTVAPAVQEATTAPAVSSGPDGAVILANQCAECHSPDRAKNAPRSRDQWESTVTRMIGKGAQLNDAEKAALVDYLATNFGK